MRERSAEEIEWDNDHERTAQCVCGSGMKNDGREFCSLKCWRDAGGMELTK